MKNTLNSQYFLTLLTDFYKVLNILACLVARVVIRVTATSLSGLHGTAGANIRQTMKLPRAYCKGDANMGRGWWKNWQRGGR